MIYYSEFIKMGFTPSPTYRIKGNNFLEKLYYIFRFWFLRSEDIIEDNLYLPILPIKDYLNRKHEMKFGNGHIYLFPSKEKKSDFYITYEKIGKDPLLLLEGNISKSNIDEILPYIREARLKALLDK